jgi:hypothetical protein
MEIMSTDYPHDGPVTNELLLAEVRGFRLEQTARFDGVAKETSDLRVWMGRLSDAVERQVQLTTRVLGFEAVVGAIASQASDNKLDIAGHDERIEVLERKSSIRALGDKAIFAAGGAGVMALIGGYIGKLFGH